MTLKEKVLAEIDEIEYVSLDVYDTLLFRMVRTPDLIFEKMYDMAPELFPEYITAGEWRELRTKAEWFARKKNSAEINLDEIYDCLPKIIENRELIRKIELECEKKFSFLNPEIEELLYEIVEVYHKKVILTSDMYLSKSNICEILSFNGLNLDSVTDVFVSCEYKKTKSSGELYRTVVSRLGCQPEKILHIGDNRGSDLVKAKGNGLKAVYYPIISEAFAKYPYIVYETEAYNTPCNDIHAIRLLAADSGNELDPKIKSWFDIGAMIMGPILAFASQWVIDTAKKNNISYIFPMMREGKFLSQLLKNEQEYRNWKGSIQPLYISRKALYPAVLSVYKAKDSMYNLSTHKMTVRQIFNLLDTEADKEFEEYYDVTISESKNIIAGEMTLYQKLEKKFCSDEFIEALHRKNTCSDEALFGYLMELGLDKNDHITFDVGWRGNAQNALQRILNKHCIGTKGIHLLINGKKFMITEHNLDDGCDIRGFTANFGACEKMLNEINIPIFEMFLMCEEGTTTGYELVNGHYVPLTKNVEYDGEQLQAMKYVQMGVLAFQKQYFRLRNKNKAISCRPEELLSLVSRLMKYPTGMEADLIGKMSYDQNFGIDSSWKIISNELLNEYQHFGYSEFIRQGKAREDEWYYGMDALIDPLKSYRSLMFEKKHYVQFSYYLFAEQIKKINEPFVVVGAGIHINDVMGFLRILNKERLVRAVFDRNKWLSGENVCGKRVNTLTYMSDVKTFVITTIDRSVSENIAEEISSVYGNDAKIYYI